MSKLILSIYDTELPLPTIGQAIKLGDGLGDYVVTKVMPPFKYELTYIRWYHRLWWWIKRNFKPCYI